VTVTISHDDEEALDLVEIESSNTRRRVRMGVDYAQLEWPNFTWCCESPFPEVDFDVVLPTTVSLEVDSHRSDMDIEAPRGDVRIKSHRGRGSVTGISSDFILDTHRGSFDLVVAELHDLDIKTHRGNVYARIENADDFRIRGESHRGRLEFSGKDIEVTQDRHRGESSVSHREGSGENRVYLDTHRGDITLSFRD